MLLEGRLNLFQVCELHFAPEDLLRTTSFFDKDTGRTLTARLRTPRLVDGAVPSILPGSPSYLPAGGTLRDPPDEERSQHKVKALKTELAPSTDKEEWQWECAGGVLGEPSDERRSCLEEDPVKTELVEVIVKEECQWKRTEFFSLSELTEKLDFLDTNYWRVVHLEDALLICRVLLAPHPSVVRSVVIKANCAVHTYVNAVEIHYLGEYKIPDAVNDTTELDFLLSELRKTDIQ